jgi:hypothetical protein
VLVADVPPVYRSFAADCATCHSSCPRLACMLS